MIISNSLNTQSNQPISIDRAIEVENQSNSKKNSEKDIEYFKLDEVRKDERKTQIEVKDYSSEPQIKAMLLELQNRDLEVRMHESAHQSAGASTGGASYSYQRGPDGTLYAIGGEVSIDISIDSTPEKTIEKMESIKRAALAPSDPSPQDLKVAATASKIESMAKAEFERELKDTLEGQTPPPKPQRDYRRGLSVAQALELKG